MRAGIPMEWRNSPGIVLCDGIPETPSGARLNIELSVFRECDSAALPPEADSGYKSHS